MNKLKNGIKLLALTCCLSGSLSSCDNRDDEFNPVPLSYYTDEILNFQPISAQFDEENQLKADFTPSSLNAVTYEITFGDVPNETPTVITAGETVTHIFPGNGSYTVTYKAISVSGNTAEVSTEVSVGLLAPLEFKFDDATGTFKFGDDTTFDVVDNPFMSGENQEDTKVGEFKKAAATFQGFGYEVKDANDVNQPIIDFKGSNKVVTAKVYSTVAVPVSLIFQVGTNNERGVEGTAEHTGSGWELLTFDYNEAKLEFVSDNDPDNGKVTVAEAVYQKFVMIINGPSDAAGTFYIDDIIQEGLN